MKLTRKLLRRSIMQGAVGLGVAMSLIVAIKMFYGELSIPVNTNPRFLIYAIVACTFYRVSNAFGWSFVLKSLGCKLPAMSVIRIWLTSEACRWLPGSVWSYGSRALQAQDHGIPTAPAVASLFLEMVLTVLAWTCAAFVGLILYQPAFDKLSDVFPISPFAFVSAVVGCISLLVIVIGLIRPSALATKLGLFFNRYESLGRVGLSYPRTVVSLSYYIAMCFLNGLAFYFIVEYVAPQSNVPVWVVIGANSAAWLVGFFAFVAPGGLVVREGVLTMLLVAWVPLELAIAAAAYWRMLQIAVEAVCIVGVCSLSRFRGQGRLLESGAIETEAVPTTDLAKSSNDCASDSESQENAEDPCPCVG